MPKKEKRPTTAELSAKLVENYSRWKEIYENGCTDYANSDGSNINLVRNHIGYHKSITEMAYHDQYWLYPEEYFYPDPPMLPYDFMAVDRVYHGFVGNKDIKPANKKYPYSELMREGVHIDLATGDMMDGIC